MMVDPWATTQYLSDGEGGVLCLVLAFLECKKRVPYSTSVGYPEDLNFTGGDSECKDDEPDVQIGDNKDATEIEMI